MPTHLTRLPTAIVGVGNFGIQYLKFLQSMPQYDLRWLCDRNPDRVAQLAHQHGIAHSTSDYRELLADPELRAVVIATPEHVHRQVTVAALEAGKHVLLEKPIATTEDDAQAIIDAETASGRLLLVAFLLRWDVRYARVKALLPQIGIVRQIAAWRNFDRNLLDQHCRTHTFIENAIHDIDLILWYVQAPVRAVHAFTRNNLGLPIPDVNLGVIEFENGTLAHIQSTWLYPRQQIERLQWNTGLQVMGERGVLEVANDQTGLRTHIEGEGIVLRDQSAWCEVLGEQRGAMGAMLRHFADCCLYGIPYRGPTSSEALEATRIAEQLAGDIRHLA